jgi:hypothetical protein
VGGERFDGRLLLRMEHGHGDAFMMLRWVSEVWERVDSLRLQVRPELVSLLAGQWSGVEVTSTAEDPGEFDRYVLSYSLPSIFGTERPEDVTRPAYLRPVTRFRRLPGPVRVGLLEGRPCPHDGPIAVHLARGLGAGARRPRRDIL